MRTPKTKHESKLFPKKTIIISFLGWSVLPELPTPKSFESALTHVHPEDVAQKISCGPDPERHVQAIRKYVEAGFDHLVLVGIGPDQPGFLRFWKEQLSPRLRA
jgi:hypothetical protein